MKIAIGADHAGYEEKERLKPILKELGVEYEDFGAVSTDSVDYPDFAAQVARKVADGEFDQGLLVCSSGTGMAIAANKIHGIRAAVAWNEETARLAREHNNVNVLAVGANTTPAGEIPNIVRAWLEAKFAGGRHERRVEKIRELEDSDSATRVNGQ